MNLLKLLPLITVFVFLSACENEPQGSTFEKKYLIGKWELTDAWRNNRKTETLTGTYYEFAENGMMKTNLTSDLSEGIFAFEFDGKTLIQKGTEEVVYSLDSLTETILIFSMNIKNFPFKLALTKSVPTENEAGLEL